MATESTEFGTGKTLIVLTVVIGCFAVLWPKIFYPAFQDASPSSKKHEGKPVCLPCAIKFEEEKKLQFHYELCNLIVKNDKEYRHKPRPASLMFRLCRETVLQACHLELDDTVVKNLQKSIEENVTTSGTANLTTCLLAEFRIDGHHIVLALHKKNASAAKQIHQERPPHLRPEMMHPALREKGQNIPPRMRTIERDARPGPMPGMRPTIGGPGHVVQSNKQASTMSIVMPIYTLVIVLFFIYTITKVLFKKNQDNTPKVMDFHMDPEQRKFVFSEEYSDADPLSMKSYLKKQERDQKRQEAEKENSKIEDLEIDQLRQRLAETEAAMERIMKRMGRDTFPTNVQVGGPTQGRNEADLLQAMKEVQEAAGVLKEEVEAKDSEVETKSANEDEEEDVSEYKSVRVEEVSTAEDYISTAHQWGPTE